MPHRPSYRAALVLACILLFAVAAHAGGAPTYFSKRGLSGQTYVWQSGSC